LHDPKHIISDIQDLMEGITDHFATLLTGVITTNEIRLAFRDERGDVDETGRVFPRATLYNYDMKPDRNRRYANLDQIAVATPGGDPQDVTVTKKPVPVSLYFQFDTYALTFEEDWAILEKLLPLVDEQQQQKVVTTLGREFYIPFHSLQNLDEITADNWFRKSWRFRAEVWFASSSAATQKYIVLQRKLSMNEAPVWTMDPAP
jgi:uncharacterized protein with NAD-binding domain and iron-sulfur cluster